jgi:hypothetical protein
MPLGPEEDEGTPNVALKQLALGTKYLGYDIQYQVICIVYEEYT